MDRVVALPDGLSRDGERVLLSPYVPTLIVDWLRERPREQYQALDCTLVFADISGFTRMTEMLAGRGKAGAEEMAGLINGTFEPLLEAAYSYGAGLIKWGGDATLLLFHGPGHASRACRAAWEMQRVMRHRGTPQTSRGPLRLRMSIGVSTGRGDFFLVGHEDHRELLVLGPVITVLTQMEKVAEATQIVVSPATAAALAQAGEPLPNIQAGEGWLLRHAPRAEAGAPIPRPDDDRGIDLGTALSAPLRDYIIAGGLESEHRYVSVGFVKFTGTDRLLTEEGPEAVAAAADHAIRAIQSAATEHGVTFLATDLGPDCGKVMLTAGAPRRMGGDEARLVATLRAAIDASGVVPISAGATTGRAFSGDYGPPYRRTYSLMGDCVNLAARLMAHAGAHELLATGELVKTLAGGFVAEPRPPFAAKGKSAPVHPFNVVGTSTSRSGGSAEGSPLIGREEELSRLLTAAREAAEGKPHVIEMVGEPGMGKSRLLLELESRVEADVFWTDGEVYAGSRAYAPFERLMRLACGLPTDAPAALLAERLRATTRERAASLIPWLPLIGIAGGAELPSTRVVSQIDPSLRKERLEELTSEWLGKVLSRPTVLILNDVHLMDDASRDLIRRLAADAPDRPWLVIVSRRPDTDGPLEAEEFERLELGPLSDAAAAALLAQATASAPLPPHRLMSLADRAAGNPLFLRELAAQLSEGGDPDSLPSSVEEAIAARIDRLSPSDRRILRGAAVLGMDVEVSLLDEVLAAEAERLEGGRVSLDRLSEFLEPISPEIRRFSHQLIREVAYDALPYGRRADLHARTAGAIQLKAGSEAEQHAELLSLHCFYGEQFEPAWHYSRLAAERARSRYAVVEAAALYGRALKAGEQVPTLDPGSLAEVDGTLGELYHDLGELETAEAAFRRGIRRAREHPTAAARLELELIRLLYVRGQHTVALRWASRAERTLGDLSGEEVRLLRARIAVRRSRISHHLGRYKNALRFAEAAIDLAQQAGDRMTLAEALEYADASAMELGLPAGRGAERALAIYQELGMLGEEARVRNTLGVLAYHHGDWQEALTHYGMAETGFTQSGRRWNAAIASANSAEILADQGRLQEARDELERAMLVWRGCGADSEIAFGQYQLGRIAARLGQGDEAATQLEAAREHYVTAGELTELAVVDALRAEALMLAGDRDGALALAEDVLGRARALGGVAAMTPLLQRVRAACLLDAGEPAAAEETLRSALDAARSRKAGHEIAFALKAMLDGEMTHGPAEEQEFRTELTVLSSALGLELI